MRGNPGKVIRLGDGRLVVMYNKQEFSGKVILNLVDEDYKPLLSDDQKPRILIKTTEQFNNEIIPSAKLIGYCD